MRFSSFLSTLHSFLFCSFRLLPSLFLTSPFCVIYPLSLWSHLSSWSNPSQKFYIFLSFYLLPPVFSHLSFWLHLERLFSSIWCSPHFFLWSYIIFYFCFPLFISHSSHIFASLFRTILSLSLSYFHYYLLHRILFYPSSSNSFFMLFPVQSCYLSWSL